VIKEVLDQGQSPGLARLKDAAIDHPAEVVRVARVLLLAEFRCDDDEPLPSGVGRADVAGEPSSARVTVQDEDDAGLRAWNERSRVPDVDRPSGRSTVIDELEIAQVRPFRLGRRGRGPRCAANRDREREEPRDVIPSARFRPVGQGSS
jgi:hypothetical protein